MSDPDSADDHVSNLPPESSVPFPAYPADEKPGFTRTWLASSNYIRTSHPTHIKWCIHWHTPVSIVLLLLAGTATAVVHHWHYSRLNHTLAWTPEYQRQVLYIGSGLSFLTKVAFTAAVGISRTQWVWLNLRTKWFTMNGIDTLFGIISDPMLFLKWRIIWETKVATIMAIVMWILPLAVILTPGTIAVRDLPAGETLDFEESCIVPSLLFPFDNRSNTYAQRFPLHDYGGDLNVVDAWTWDESNDIGFFDSMLNVDLDLAMYNGTIAKLPALPRPPTESRNTIQSSCSGNCTYTINFLGPAIICNDITEWGNTNWPNSIEYMNGSNYRPQMTYAGRYSFILGIDSVHTLGPSVFIECKPGTAQYTVKHVMEEWNFHQPMITQFRAAEPLGRVLDPNGNDEFIVVLMSVVFGTVKQPLQPGGKWDYDSLFAMNRTNITAGSSKISKAIESMAQRMVVSLIAFGNVFKIDDPVLNITALEWTFCTRHESTGIYIYSKRTLLIVYGLALASALASSVAGFIALRENGMSSNRKVSTIIRTTRNSTLDNHIVGTDSLGGIIMSSELAELKLQFGVLKANGRMGTALFALGVDGEIEPIKRD